jgi:hypothetical protein
VRGYGALVAIAPAQRERAHEEHSHDRQHDRRQRRRFDQRRRIADSERVREPHRGRDDEIRHEEIADLPRPVRRSARDAKRLGQHLDVVAGEKAEVAVREPELHRRHHRGDRGGDAPPAHAAGVAIAGKIFIGLRIPVGSN